MESAERLFSRVWRLGLARHNLPTGGGNVISDCLPARYPTQSHNVGEKELCRRFSETFTSNLSLLITSFFKMSDENDKYPLHTAAREGRGWFYISCTLTTLS